MAQWRDRRHWEFRIGRTLVARWCDGAPCSLSTSTRHPLTVVRVRK